MKRKLIFSGLAGMLLMASTASAAITGTMNISGSVRVGTTTIDWVPLGGPTGTVQTIFPGTGFFSGIFNPAAPPGDYLATVQDLSNPPTGVGVATSVPNFLFNFTAPGYAALTYELTYIFPATAPVCLLIGQPLDTPCAAVAGSPFTLTNTATGVAIRFGVDGVFRFPGETDALATGSYTTQLNGQTIQQVLTTLGTTGFIDSGYSAEFTVVPEPSTTAMMIAGFGLLAAGVIRRKKS
jgi:hypothetical protein